MVQPSEQPSGEVEGLRFRSEEWLERSIDPEQEYALLFKHIGCGIAYHEILVDDSGIPVDYRFLRVNPAFERMTGLHADAILGKTVLEVLPNTEQVWIDRYGQVAQTGIPSTFQEYSSELGKHFEVSAFSPLPGHFAVAFHDVTERVLAETAIREREFLLRSFYDSPGTMRGIVEMLDDDILHILDNAVAAQFFGRPPQSMQGCRASELGVPRSTIETWLQQCRQCQETGDSVQFEYDHDQRRFSVTVTLLGQEAGKAPRFAYAINDITPRHQATLTLEESNRQLATALAQLEQAQDSLIHQARLNALSQMVSGVAHSINNALTPLIGYADLLMAYDKGQDPRLTKYIDRIRSSADHACAVVSQMREFSRSNTSADSFKQLDLNDLVQNVVAFTEPKWKTAPQLANHQIDLRLELETLPPLLGDSAQLREALTNLVFNAAEAMPEGGQITISTRNDQDSLVLRVRDNGEGMTETARAHCFEPFFTTKGKHATGLGLAMTYGIVKRHEGTIVARPANPKGTEFVLRFPNTAKAAVAVEPALGPATANELLRIHYVEDEPSVREIVTEMLETLGHQVTPYDDPTCLVSAFKANDVDLVLTDRAMPQMSGDQLAVTIKEHAPAIPIIMLTGFGDLMNAADDRPDAVDYVLGKPTTPNALQDAINHVLSNTR